MNTLVSVIIPTYKRPDFLKRAIDSVLNQTYNNIEVIVVDDNNPDTDGRYQTELLMAEYIDNNKVFYLKHEKNKNGSAARNTGARFSHGEYIAFLDDDDEFLPDKVKSQLECLEKKSLEYVACYSWYVRLDSSGKIVDKCGEFREGYLYLEALKRNFFAQAGSNLLIKKTAYECIGGFDESFSRNQDIEFMVRLLKNNKIAYCPTEGLVIHLEEQKKGIGLDVLTEKYIKNFDGIISSLKVNEKQEVLSFLYLQVYRYYLMKRDIKKAKRVRKENKISMRLINKYCFHLIRRKLKHICEGFVY